MEGMTDQRQPRCSAWRGHGCSRRRSNQFPIVAVRATILRSGLTRFPPRRPAPSFRIAASAQHPIANLCFVVKNWNGEDADHGYMVPGLEINSKPQPAGPAYRQGIERDPNGRTALVVWLQMQATEPVAIRLRGAKPALAGGRLRSLTWATVPRTVTNNHQPWSGARRKTFNGEREFVFLRGPRQEHQAAHFALRSSLPQQHPRPR